MIRTDRAARLPLARSRRGLAVAALPSGLETFVEEVIPLLRKRGLFRTEYACRTLRDHYGIARPDSQFAVAAARDR